MASARVMDLIGTTPRLSVEVTASIPAEMLIGLLKFSMQDSEETFDVGSAWFEEVRKKASPQLMDALRAAEHDGIQPAGDLIGLALEPPACSDVPAFLRRVREMEADELWLAVAGYHVVPLRERVGTEIYSRAAAGEAEARQAIVESVRQLDRDSDESLSLTPRLELNVADAKDLILQILERWYEDIFRATEAETQAILVRDVEAKRAMAPRLSPEALIEAATNGLEFRREPWARRVILVPHVALRPWNTMSGWEELYILGYPVADESLGVDSSAPPASLLRLHKALGDEKRLRMLKILAGGSTSLQQLAHATGLAKSSAHHHLVILRAAGLVRVTTGEESIYTLRRDFIPEASAMLGTFLEGRPS
jgi:DNA-binding transcriptional ArsR family regulator